MNPSRIFIERPVATSLLMLAILLAGLLAYRLLPLSALPEVLRFVAGPLQELSGGRLDAAILRQLLIAVAMISVMLLRPSGLWPSPNEEHSDSKGPKDLNKTGGEHRA